MASKLKARPFAALFELQESMEVETTECASCVNGLKNTIKRQPLCSEAVTALEQLEHAASSLLRMAKTYRKELAELAKGGNHAS